MSAENSSSVAHDSATHIPYFSRPSQTVRSPVAFDVPARKFTPLIWIAVLCVSAALELRAQEDRDYVRAQPVKENPAPSRAEKEAAQQVSLSPDKIIDILRNEPGLLLQVKKMLVRKAYEQGRI